jgi:hypothetical protein
MRLRDWMLSLALGCGGASATTSDAGRESRSDAGTDGAGRLDGADGGANDGGRRPVAERLAELEAARVEAWATVHPRTTFGIENEWEVVYDGVGAASDHAPNHLRWDSFIDDDWAHPEWGFQLDTPEVGFLTVDRLSYHVGGDAYACPFPTPPAGTDALYGVKTGNIWRRDEVLRSEDEGFTLEVRVRLFDRARECSAAAPAEITRNAFSIAVLDDEGNYGVHLSPDAMRLGALSAGATTPPPADYAIDATAFHTYRIIRYPSADDPGRFYVYVDDRMLDDGRPRPYAGSRAGGSTLRAARDGTYYSYPRILIGDNENTPPRNARYELDYVYYRRGVVPQLRAGPPVSRRTPLPLPPFESFEGAAFEGAPSITAADLREDGTLPPPFRTRGALALEEGAIAIRSMQHAMLGAPEDEPSLPHVEPFSIELVARVAADSHERGFVLEHIDLGGAIALVLSPDKVELFMDSSPYGAAVYSLDTTDRPHRYRIVRTCSRPGAPDCLYAHLYVDGDPVPVIADQHLGGTVLALPRLWFGDLAYADAAREPHVTIESIRWSKVALAPFRPE